MNQTFGAEYLDEVVDSEYGCGCNDPYDPWIKVQVMSGDDYDFWAFINGR